ncbi:MAG: NAD(P)H-dependent glycerol-3-phosphate dehydrogenase [Bradymonadia bacterium]
MKTTVLGGGSWGTALAAVLAKNGPVRLWARSSKIAEHINDFGRNPVYQSDIDLPEELTATTDMQAALAGAELVCIVVPSHAMRTVMSQAAVHLPDNAALVSASKGIENDTLMTMDDVLREVLPPKYHRQLAYLSGPSFARETLLKMATAVTIAAHDDDVCEFVQRTFSTQYFRAYRTDDVIGVELGGALKNVVAIAAGIVDGMGLGHNTRAALLTRGIAEMTRLAVHLGANPLTLSGLAGMGDLVLTCTGDLSRNRAVGKALGQGEKLGDILDSMNQVAEGVRTTRSAYDLARREGIEMPIAVEVYRILYEEKPARKALMELMTRELKAERA